MNQQAMINMLLNKAGNNPIVTNVIGMFQRGDSRGVEDFVRNVCQTKGVNPDDALKNAQHMFGMR